MFDKPERISWSTCTGLVLLLAVISQPHASELREAFSLPEFTQNEDDAWINSGPLTREDLHGKVTLISFWTFGCINCRRSLPWLESLASRYAGEGLNIVGIHTPEFAREKPRVAVVSAIKLHEIKYPVMMDNDMRFWNALANRYWPAFYVVDKQTQVVGYYVGETHINDRQALVVETQLERLLAAD
jgi:thiol-disulfide isomerase/thioredoxin